MMDELFYCLRMFRWRRWIWEGGGSAFFFLSWEEYPGGLEQMGAGKGSWPDNGIREVGSGRQRKTVKNHGCPCPDLQNL